MQSEDYVRSANGLRSVSQSSLQRALTLNSAGSTGATAVYNTFLNDRSDGILAALQNFSGVQGFFFLYACLNRPDIQRIFFLFFPF